MKKSIGFIFFFTLLICYQLAVAQPCDSIPYQHIYYNKTYHDTRIKNFSFASNNDIYITGTVNQFANNSNTDGWLMRTTFHGTPLWSKTFGTAAEETVTSIRSTNDDGFMYAGATRANSLYDVGWLAKINSAGDMQWSLRLKNTNGSLSQTVELANGDFVAVGSLYINFRGDNKGNITDISHSTNFIMRIDKTGKLIWQRSFYHNPKETLNKVQQLSDGNLIVTGNDEDSEIAYIIKISQMDGSIIWMNEYANTENYNLARITENVDGSLKFKTGSRSYYFTNDGKFETAATQIILSSGNRQLTNIPIADFGAVGTNEIYYANINPNPVLFAVKNNTDVQWAHVYNINDVNRVNLGSGHIYQNNIYLSGAYKADKLSDTSLDEQTAYLLKATLAGKTFCSDTFEIGFKISDIPPGANTTYTWTDEGAIVLEYITLYSKDLEPVRLYDCTQQTCCNDTAVSNAVAICDNASYKLPNGKLVQTPGFYSSRMNTSIGCDSIIYTKLSNIKKIDFSLSKDTCLQNNMPVTFLLPEDTAWFYRWQDGTISNQYTAAMPGKYWVTAISACNAVVDSVLVYPNCTEPVYIPSAFTPGNDGLNDIFRVPEISGQHLLNFNIYNRYGQLIFHTANAAEGWNGSSNNIPQPSGVYVYLIKYTDIIGKPHLLKGTVVLIR